MYETKNICQLILLYTCFAQHKRMYAWISLTATPELDDRLEAGKNYCVQNFNVEPFTGMYRCFEADKHIVLTTSTRIQRLPDSWGLIPDQIFYFTNLRHIEQHPPEDTYLIGKSNCFLMYKHI